MSARCAGWSAFRHCVAAFKDLILHCWLRQRRRQRTASASQVSFFSSSFSLFFPSSQREGRKCSGKKSVPICSFLPLTKLLPLFFGEGSPPKSRKPQPDQHLLREPIGRRKCRDISPPLFVEHSGVSTPSPEPPLPSHPLPASKDSSACSLIPVCFSCQAKGNQQATHG